MDQREGGHWGVGGGLQSPGKQVGVGGWGGRKGWGGGGQGVTVD